MKICAYVQTRYAKATYKTECFNVRAWVGMSVIIDVLSRAGYTVEYAGKDTVHQYDIVLVSLTSDCDWWQFIPERTQWRKGNYKVIIGGAGLLNIRPFLEYADCFVWGRGENIIVPLVEALAQGEEYHHESVAYRDTFFADRAYKIAQVDESYPYEVRLSNGKIFREREIGCPHKCLFCGYTWQRKYVGAGGAYIDTSVWGENMSNKEVALLDWAEGKSPVTIDRIGITSIDGFSERLRFSVNKRISKDLLKSFFTILGQSEFTQKMKIYNIVGLPSETEEDWSEFLQTIAEVDTQCSPGKQWGIILHNTPFRAMPATPMACAPMSYKNYRGEIARFLGQGRYKGNIFFQGNKFWAVESGWTDSLPTVILSAICHRGVEADADNVRKIACSKKFWRANLEVKQKTLEKYFDVATLFGSYEWNNLPTRYLKTYAPIIK